MYGVGVFYEDAANELIPGAYSKAAQECGENIVSQPQIDVTQIGKGQPFIFTAEVALKPEVTLGEYKGLEVEKSEIAVSEEEVEKAVDKERENNARIPGFEEQLVGAKIGEDVEVNVTFPEEYHVEDLKSKAAVFKCKVNEIKVKELPEADDEFAKDVSEFDTLAEYKDDIRAKLLERKEKEAKRAKENKVVELAVANASMDIPDAMVNEQVRRMAEDFSRRLQSQGLTMEQYMQFTGMTADKLLEQMRPEALKRIQNSLVLEAIAKAENIQVSEERLDEEYAKMAQQYKMEVEKIKEIMDSYAKEQMKNDLAIQAAVEMITEAAKEVEAAKAE